MKDIQTIKWNTATDILYERYLACYLLYDWNIYHAENSFQLNQILRYQEVEKRLNNRDSSLPLTEEVITEEYNAVLVDDIEGWIENHMKVWECNRAKVENAIATIVAKIRDNNL